MLRPSPRLASIVVSTTAAGLAGLLVLLAPRPAHACSQPDCWRAVLVPGPDLEQAVPANLPALVWRPLFGQGAPPPDPAAVTLAPVDRPDQPVALTASETDDGDLLLELGESLEPGVTYRLADASVCTGGETGPAHEFEAGDEAPLPASLGELVATDAGVGTISVATAKGSCGLAIQAARVEIELEPDPEAEPWMEVLHFETLVDGTLWQPSSDITVTTEPGASWVGRGRDLVHAACDPDELVSTDPGAEQGTHEVIMRASLPGTDLAFETAPITIDVRCGAGGEDDAGDGSEDDPGDDAGEPSEGGPDGEDDEGGCSASRSGGTGAGILLVLAVLLVSSLRRRLIARPRTCDHA